MEEFKSVIHKCNLQEIPFIGPKFTWSRGKGSNMILERLDRGFANAEWFIVFFKVCKQHLIALQSDHAPILFHVSSQ